MENEKKFFAKTFIGRRTEKSVGWQNMYSELTIGRDTSRQFIFSFKTFNFVRDFLINFLKIDSFFLFLGLIRVDKK